MAQLRQFVLIAVPLAVIGTPVFALEWQDQIVGNSMPGWEVKGGKDNRVDCRRRRADLQWP